MKISLNWIKEYTKLRMAMTELVTTLTQKSVEVEAITHFSELWKGIVVGEVINLQMHGKASRLKIAKVDTGIKILDIVCGAENIARGQKVAVALPGTTLPNGMTIQKAIIRGTESEGMICATEELGLPKEGNMDIMILDHKLKAGTPLAKALLLDQEVLTIDVLPNRSDLLSHQGSAREIAVLTNSKFASDVHKLPRKTRNTLTLHVTIQDSDACPRYSALVLDNVTISESPHWMKNRLRSVGIRSFNNIVDLTNYIMMDVGLPLHAFDYDRIAGKTMTLRHSVPEEELTTLDGVNRKLPEGTIVIQDADKLIDLAGIMGGENSAITHNTKRIILQSALFDPKSIRKTSRKLMLHTEAVQRFERGVNHAATLEALAKAYDLLKEMQDDMILDSIIDIERKTQELGSITLHYARYEKIIGESVEARQIIQILERIGCRIEQKEAGFVVVTPSAWRTDLHYEEDLIEEIARIVGYDSIQEKLPEVRLTLWPVSRHEQRKEELQRLLKTLGFQEVINFSFASKKNIENMSGDTQQHISVENPMNAEQAFLRSELLSSLLKNLKENQHRTQEGLQFFEIAHVYSQTEENFSEHMRLVGVSNEKYLDFYQLKGIVSALLLHMGVSQCQFQMTNNHFTEPGTCAQITWGHQIIGSLGKLHQRIQQTFGIENAPWYFDLDAEKIIDKVPEVMKAQEIEKFPAVLHDLAIIVDVTLSWDVIEALIQKETGSLLASVELFDMYQGSQIPAGKKSLAFHLVYQSNERTLTQKEVTPVHERLINALQQHFHAQVRSLSPTSNFVEKT
ncbi:MAG: phenylalanine--tRNA ligase subunit beta [Candidatus Kerfeldbacteria bacterium RIFCSPHIGHO2_02_FULL_42_14]|uniref:Phenylalanine--tRNA ligase beta subunit n=1 Tax=Candidatus Kerfeldbacteria bacterium RIFCSPHIGHO2_02_FULL_42_14 TaxID=1798540 RepID=A0A1G2AUV6_9BACT|nr:MAG: phenylalanine--tRNA ligase subunit beta [Candidatus Kerfeldbacteria bacterium RIFCSPHIGHO2_02_FULL_42_14]OGY82721.1 MAG: phenylalanine--tRNA ligase subunit beta [Candidatus Kerfeldbacteria bacterium RIFCSPLOWO2_02_FULL_42_19]OGY86083.1 MAG: phenylalanine--tRNA ligase subunit beta [Candidatus Kerfeldbacteria bacterium RIFCSPLOWO2_12_FULL_43_9]